MWHNIPRAALAASVFLLSVANAIPHGDDDSMDMEMTMEMDMGSGNLTASNAAVKAELDNWPMSYFAYGKHSGTIIAHIVLMVVAWCFVLPSGK